MSSLARRVGEGCWKDGGPVDFRKLEDSDANFATTRWTLVNGLRDEDERARAAALETLCSRYWAPVYAYVRRSGRAREAAAEVTQGFFADMVLWRELFETADQSIGRFRSLVLAALKRYLVDQHRRADVRRTAALSDDAIGAEEARLSSEPELLAEVAFERRWALTVVHEALRECERHFVSTGKKGHWGLFEDRVLMAARGHEPRPLADAAGNWGFESSAAAGAAIQVVRDRLRALVTEAARESGMNGEAALLAELR